MRLEEMDSNTEKWMNEYLIPHYPFLVSDFKRALEGYNEIIESNKVTIDSFEKIFNAVDNSHSTLANAILPYLDDLSGKHQELQTILLRQMQNSKWQTRSNIILCVNKNWDHEILTALLKAGLTDKSHHVRYVTAKMILILRSKDLIPELKLALSSENHQETKEEINYSYQLLKYGHCLNNFGNRRIFWIMTKNGIEGTDFPFNHFQPLIMAFLIITSSIKQLLSP
jgi:hypothetical protein